MPIAYWLYAVSLLAAYVALFGAGGLFSGFIVLGMWAFVFCSDHRSKALMMAVAIVILGGCLWTSLVLVPCSREAAMRSQCKNNLKQIGWALHNYHDDFGSFPPAYVADENGKPMHSWRVLLLPYFDDKEQDLFERYDFSQPWDSEENLKFLKHMPSVFACPSHIRHTDEPGKTSYFAIVDPETAWPGSDTSNVSEMKDGTSNIAMVIESHSSVVPWTEPRDLSLEEAVETLGDADFEVFSGHRRESFFYEYLDGRYVLWGDGSVLFARPGTDRTLAGELLTINDGKPGFWVFSFESMVRRERLKWDVVILFVIFVAVTLLPLPWVWLNPTSTTKTTPESEIPREDQE